MFQFVRGKATELQREKEKYTQKETMIMYVYHVLVCAKPTADRTHLQCVFFPCCAGRIAFSEFPLRVVFWYLWGLFSTVCTIFMLGPNQFGLVRTLCLALSKHVMCSLQCEDSIKQIEIKSTSVRSSMDLTQSKMDTQSSIILNIASIRAWHVFNMVQKQQMSPTTKSKHTIGFVGAFWNLVKSIVYIYPHIILLYHLSAYSNVYSTM